MSLRCGFPSHKFRFENETQHNLEFNQDEVDVENGVRVIRITDGRWKPNNAVIGHCDSIEYTLYHGEGRRLRYDGMCEKKKNAKIKKEKLKYERTS